MTTVMLRNIWAIALASLALMSCTAARKEPVAQVLAPTNSCNEVVLPFAYTVETSEKVPNFLDQAANKTFYDAQFTTVKMDGAFWVFQTECDVKPNYTPDTHFFHRWKGTCVDDCVKQANGVLDETLQKDGGRHWIMGLWYDEAASKLYSVMHVEFNYTGTNNVNGFNWMPRKIILASSKDKGLTWNNEGDILTSEYPTGLLDFYQFSGANRNSGIGDFNFFVDTRGGYFYIHWVEYEGAKGDNGNYKAFPLYRHVGRCAISDKLAPGKWKKFYNGAWTEPGIGGKSSVVFSNAGLTEISYNRALGKYLAFVVAANGQGRSALGYGYFIAVCTSLEKQDWLPCGFIPEITGPPILTAINREGTDEFNTDETFRLYAYYIHDSKRLNITIRPGATSAFCMTQDYNYEPFVESTDPTFNRKTKIVGSGSGEMQYAGSGWARKANRLFYQGRSKASDVAGDSVEFAFKGADVYWRAIRSNKGGKADVFVDQVFQKEVDLYEPCLLAPYQFLYIKTGLDPKAYHTIKIVVKGAKNERSAGALVQHMAFEYSAESYKASAGFSSIMGKNHWYFEERNRSNYSALSFFAPDEKQFYNYYRGTGLTRISDTYQVADATDAVRKWVAPHDGNVRIEGVVAVSQETLGNSVAARITLNDAVLWGEKTVTNEEREVHDLWASVKQGDALRFIARRTDPQNPGRAEWNPTITYEDHPLHAAGLAAATPVKAADVQPKVLFDFENDNEIRGLCRDNSKAASTNFPVERVGEHATSGKSALKVSYSTDGDWPGIHFVSFDGDWSKYNALKIDVFNPTDKVVTLHFAGADQDSGITAATPFGAVQNRFQQDMAIKPGKHTITIELDGVMTASRERLVNLAAIKRFALFVTDRPINLVLYFDNIRLENENDD